LADVPDEEQRNRLGGMALANGLLVHGPEHWAAAVRDDDGEIHVASGEKPRLKSENRLAKLPLVRGVVRLGEALLVVPVVRRGMPEARLAFEEGPVGVAARSPSLPRPGGGSPRCWPRRRWAPRRG
jgi:hypothetical protein